MNQTFACSLKSRVLQPTTLERNPRRPPLQRAALPPAFLPLSLVVVVVVVGHRQSVQTQTQHEMQTWDQSSFQSLQVQPSRFPFAALLLALRQQQTFRPCEIEKTKTKQNQTKPNKTKQNKTITTNKRRLTSTKLLGSAASICRMKLGLWSAGRRGDGERSLRRRQRRFRRHLRRLSRRSFRLEQRGNCVVSARRRRFADAGTRAMHNGGDFVGIGAHERRHRH